MGKWIYLGIGAAVGAGAAVVMNYLFGPAQGTTFDASYQSRLDRALEAGEQAADAREKELRQTFRQAKETGQIPDSDLPL